MDSHSKIAQEIFNLITQTGMSVPVKDVEKMVEIKSWLTSIADGALIVTNKPELVVVPTDDTGG